VNGNRFLNDDEGDQVDDAATSMSGVSLLTSATFDTSEKLIVACAIAADEGAVVTALATILRLRRNFFVGGRGGMSAGSGAS
jgi:hypothetical protein